MSGRTEQGGNGMSDPLVVQSTDPDGTTETPLVVTSVGAPDPNPPSPEPVPEPQSVRADTAYMILALSKMTAPGAEESDTTDVWSVEEDSVLAKTPGDAIRQFAEGGVIVPDEGLMLVAIAAKFWKPVPVKTKTETTLVIGDA